MNRITLADLPAYQPRSFGKAGPSGRKSAGQYDRRILGSVEREGVTYSYHATKGWRASRVPTGHSLVGMPIPAPGSARYALTQNRAKYLRAGGRARKAVVS